MGILDKILRRKKSPDQKISDFLNRLSDESEKWTTVKWGRYLHKPTLSRAVSYIVGIAEENAVILIQNNKVKLNNEVVTNSALRLGAGDYVVHISERGYYEFYIK